MNKLYYFKYVLFLLLTLSIFSCDDHDHDHDPEPDDASVEYRYLRILISDETSSSLSLVAPFSGEVTSFEARFPKSALYTTESGRYAGIIHRENNLTEFFDTGFESHGDHIDVKGTPKFGSLLGESLLPTHFKSKVGEVLTFNDGDGTLSVGYESDIHTVGAKMATIDAGLLKHHGAMATFSNGTYAVTEKDNSIAGVLPERVKIIDRTGKTLHTSSIATQGIHGNATDGTYAVFGSASGILVVENNGEQKLIDHPADFGSAWFGSILETAYKGKFIGYTAAKGVYAIDVTNGTVSPIFENTGIMQCKVSRNGSKIGVLLHTGDFKLFDLNTLTLLREGNIIQATETTSTQKPQMELSERFAYITQPQSGELIQVLLSDLTKKETIKVSSTPYRLALIGHESSASH